MYKLFLKKYHIDKDIILKYRQIHILSIIKQWIGPFTKIINS